MKKYQKVHAWKAHRNGMSLLLIHGKYRDLFESMIEHNFNNNLTVTIAYIFKKRNGMLHNNDMIGFCSIKI